MGNFYEKEVILVGYIWGIFGVHLGYWDTTGDKLDKSLWIILGASHAELCGLYYTDISTATTMEGKSAFMCTLLH